ncbi:hypothetical protein K502DRAFT_322588 [Neoconidiobolus thromboides FSU 785]|nr:hypothetical protein K502DRAFT_322588 [Neoconidiobolus thromboides FSU 785]
MNNFTFLKKERETRDIIDDINEIVTNLSGDTDKQKNMYIENSTDILQSENLTDILNSIPSLQIEDINRVSNLNVNENWKEQLNELSETSKYECFA